ncbi:MAG: hypothetical protein ACR2K0_08405 [Acidimicrobiales bacterium]
MSAVRWDGTPVTEMGTGWRRPGPEHLLGEGCFRPFASQGVGGYGPVAPKS